MEALGGTARVRCSAAKSRSQIGMVWTRPENMDAEDGRAGQE